LIFSSILGKVIKTEDLGLLQDWQTIQTWLNKGPSFTENFNKPTPVFKKKCPEIPKLQCYKSKPDPKFWENFPCNSEAKPHVNVKKLEEKISSCQSYWTLHEKKVAKHALQNLKSGTKSFFIKRDPTYFSLNANSSFNNGEMMTDTIAMWTKKHHVIGPFEKPPVKNLQISPLMAAVQKNKVRPILNLSAPEGSSYNDALDPLKIPKISMSSAKKFSQSLLKAGKDATFAKQDLVDAYKIIPCNQNEWKFFGFKWLDKFFIDISTPFGSKSAPANFDSLGETILNITKTETKTNKKWIHRQLDDTPIVSPKNSGITEKFTEKYREICKDLNVDLAPYCPDHEKAFGPSTEGTVLGITFNSKKLNWKLPKDKLNETMSMINSALSSDRITLLNFQKLHGKLNDVIQLNTFLKSFRFHQNKFLKEFAEKNALNLQIPMLLKKELFVWANCIFYTKEGLPIPDFEITPNHNSTTFISDAAGASKNDDEKSKNDSRGAASLGYKNDSYFFFSTIEWPKSFLEKHPSDSMLFETVGLLLPFMCIPEFLCNRIIVLQLDNISILHAWKKRLSKNDELTSILIMCLHLIEYALPCKIFIDHVQRRTTKESILVDNFSRSSTIKTANLKSIDHLKISKPKGSLLNWLKNTNADWTFPKRFVNEITNHINSTKTYKN
jgi:hypothetical protein